MLPHPAHHLSLMNMFSSLLLARAIAQLYSAMHKALHPVTSVAGNALVSSTFGVHRPVLHGCPLDATCDSLGACVIYVSPVLSPSFKFPSASSAQRHSYQIRSFQGAT